MSSEEIQTGNKAVAEFKTYLRTLGGHRRTEARDPETDVLTRLIIAEDAENLSETELLQNCIFIFYKISKLTILLITNRRFK